MYEYAHMSREYGRILAGVTQLRTMTLKRAIDFAMQTVQPVRYYLHFAQLEEVRWNPRYWFEKQKCKLRSCCVISYSHEFCDCI